MNQIADKRELEKLERIILKKAIEIEGNNEIYESKLLRSKYPPMNQRLCPWKEIRKENTKHKNIMKTSYKKTKKATSNKKTKPYFKNQRIAQQYNIYPVQKSVFPTPLQYIFIGDEEYQNLQTDIFRKDASYLFPKNHINFTLSKYFDMWKNKTTLKKKEHNQLKKKSQTKLLTDNNSRNVTLLKNDQIIYSKRKWLNDDYEISPISAEYYSQKKLKPTKTSDRLFQSSLSQSKIGDFQTDKIWKKIINYV